MWSEILDILTSAQVVETSVTITDNSPSQDYTHPDYTITCLPTGGPSSRLEKANDEFMNASRVTHHVKRDNSDGKASLKR